MSYDKEILKLERKLASLKARSIKSDARKKKTALRRVASLLKKLGYDSIQELLEIADTVAVVTASKRKRARITVPIKKGIISALKKGMTTKAVAEKYKVSTAAVSNIKAAAGLTRSKKLKKAAPRKPSKPRRKFKPSKAPKTPATVPIAVDSLTE
jgi:hypothetical protein